MVISPTREVTPQSPTQEGARKGETVEELIKTLATPDKIYIDKKMSEFKMATSRIQQKIKSISRCDFSLKLFVFLATLSLSISLAR